MFVELQLDGKCKRRTVVRDPKLERASSSRYTGKLILRISIERKRINIRIKDPHYVKGGHREPLVPSKGLQLLTPRTSSQFGIAIPTNQASSADMI